MASGKNNPLAALYQPPGRPGRGTVSRGGRDQAVAELAKSFGRNRKSWRLPLHGWLLWAQRELRPPAGKKHGRATLPSSRPDPILRGPAGTQITPFLNYLLR